MMEYQVRLKDSYMYSEVKLFGVKLSKYKTSIVSESVYASLSRVLGVNLAVINKHNVEQEVVAAAPSTPTNIEFIESDSKGTPFIDDKKEDPLIDVPIETVVPEKFEVETITADTKDPVASKEDEVDSLDTATGTAKKRGRKSSKSIEVK